jgi:hypothetical protein
MNTIEASALFTYKLINCLQNLQANILTQCHTLGQIAYFDNDIIIFTGFSMTDDSSISVRTMLRARQQEFDSPWGQGCFTS